MLHYASMLGDIISLEYILDFAQKSNFSRFDIDIRDIHGNTPLSLACSHGFVEVVEFLIASGARLDVKNEEKETLLHQAAKFGHAHIIDILMHNHKNSFNIEDLNKSGCTALMSACTCGHTEAALVLIDNVSFFLSLFFL